MVTRVFSDVPGTRLRPSDYGLSIDDTINTSESTPFGVTTTDP